MQIPLRFSTVLFEHFLAREDAGGSHVLAPMEY